MTTATAFKKLSSVRTLTIPSDDENEEDTNITIGSCLMLRPTISMSNKSSQDWRTATIDGDHYWHVIADEIRTSDNGKAYIKARWFYRYSDFCQSTLSKKQRKLLDNLGITMLGRRELVLTDHTDYHVSTCIECTSDIVKFHMDRVDLRPMSPDDVYWRGLRVLGMQSEMSIYKHVDICVSACGEGGKYSPDQDVLRWCPQCTKWFHLGCIASLLGEIPDDTKQTYFLWAAHHSSEDDYSAIWGRVLSWPIQRGLDGAGYPLSFEIVVQSIREYHADAGVPEQPEMIIEEAMEQVTDEDAAEKCAEFISLDIPSYCVCPICNSII